MTGNVAQALVPAGSRLVSTHVVGRTRRHVAFSLCLLAGVAFAQQSAVIRTETRVVLVDTIVAGKNGGYIRDLTVKDFHVFEDNKEQTIASFAFESSTAAAQPRSLVLFFDESSMEALDQIPARHAAYSFIDAETGPNRKMAVVSYDGVLRVKQNFTDNAGRLKESLPQPGSRLSQDANLGRRGTARIDDTGARNMLRSLRNLGESLGTLPGRKIVVLFAGKLASTAAQRSDLREAIDACNRSGVAVYPIDVRPVSAQSDTGGFLDVPRVGRRGPNGPQGDSAGFDPGLVDTGNASQQLLLELANRTGGFVVRNSNDLLRGLQEIAVEQDEYYALTYAPPESKEGSCHTLRVKVDRVAATVRARNSYCTAKPEDLLAGTSTVKDLEKRAAEAQSGNMAASISLPYFYAAPNVARVNVAMEITPGELKFERQKGRLHAEINLLGIASTEDGGVRARFSDALRFDFDNEAQIAAWKVKPLHYQKEFRIASGQYKFTMAFGQAGQADATFGKVEVPLAIDAWDGSELTLSGLVLSRETHPAADVGLGLSIGDQTPLIAEGTQVVPFGASTFTKSKPGFFYFEAWDPDPPSVKVRIRALDSKTGEAKWDSGVSKLLLPGQSGKPSIPAVGKLPLDSLGAGSWRLEVTVSDSSGKVIIRTVNFEIQ